MKNEKISFPSVTAHTECARLIWRVVIPDVIGLLSLHHSLSLSFVTFLPLGIYLYVCAVSDNQLAATSVSTNAVGPIA